LDVSWQYFAKDGVKELLERVTLHVLAVNGPPRKI
jgi:hypothetical protein